MYHHWQVFNVDFLFPKPQVVDLEINPFVVLCSNKDKMFGMIEDEHSCLNSR